MQTFLPYPDVEQSVRCLDYRRLGKQRVEAFQILRTLRGHTSGWANHPAVKMWKGFESTLELYMNAAIREWVRRGYRNNMELSKESTLSLPPWFGDDGFHASHRSNLLRKDPAWYSQFSWAEPDDLPYVWP